MEVNSHAYTQFMERYTADGDAIFRFCLLRVSDREQALDLTQETFARFWQALQAGQSMTNARAFIFTVARRLIIDWYRKKKPVSIESLADDGTGESFDIADSRALEEIVDGSDGRLLIQALGKLHPTHREVMYLRFIEDLSPQEIAQVLGITANAASVRIHRGLAELRKIAGIDTGIDIT
ncbi:MAG: sigma-70 family RNA polymerase sigma factor [Patescibacteria group bacterium]|nr:sigma-70 family RNA polymerase sigma factor [Patescibacteria group bacterium]MDE2172691.1 sigma-70 family RNA polymerase sigma factor [Patescibacteria group bacterium]